ncbi:MAG: DUF169 domain-containing protein [Ktedonobacteraceae bacterium]|nr:DUF169 domain-containing protein [Ktedonobacteraceae bacterium]MBO0791731.1 DUF169 domain-containing protein [Ktedonobacteraceae bacterium]
MYQDLTDRFVALLHLSHVPVGLSFVEQVPESVQRTTKRVPSACTFWRLGEQDVFYALAEDHQECPIGMMTMGFTMPESAQQRAQALVETMANVQYFSPSEVSALPVVQKPHQAIVYGRLDRFPVEPDVVLCRLDTQQAMLIAEAQGQVNWLQSGQSAFGRPTCGVIPRTLKTGEASMSFGCVGARTYLDLTPSEVILTMPGKEFAGLVEKVQTIVAANQALAPFHQQQKATFPV